MFSWKDLWNRWLASEDEVTSEKQRSEPRLEAEPEKELSPESELPDPILWTPRLLTV